MSHVPGAGPVGQKILTLWRQRYPARLAELDAAGTLAPRLLAAQAEAARQFDAVKARMEKENPLHPHPTMLDRIDYYKLIEADAWDEVARTVPAP
ncbi:MAG: hypothetical protein HQK87_07440 [Nitrospinae bacterium]|nr:hypothetical protein [Nitrospinota bacterium]